MNRKIWTCKMWDRLLAQASLWNLPSLSILAILAVLVFLTGPVAAAELTETERTQREKEAGTYKKQNNFPKAEQIYRKLLGDTPEEKVKLRAVYFFELGYCLFKQGEYDPAISNYKRAWDLDEDFAEAFFQAGVAMYKKYEKFHKEEDLGGAKARMIDAQVLGFDVIEKIKEITAPPKPPKGRRPPRGPKPRPKPKDKLATLLDDPGFVFKLLNAEKFEFDPSMCPDPFRCPLRKKVEAEPANGGKKRVRLPGTTPPLAKEKQRFYAEKAEEHFKTLKNALRDGDEELAVKSLRELRKIFIMVDNGKFESPYKKRLEKMKEEADKGALKAQIEHLQGRIFVEDGGEFIRYMKAFQEKADFANVDAKFAELLKLTTEMCGDKYLDKDGKPRYARLASKFMDMGNKIKIECDAVQEFKGFPLKVRAIVYRQRASLFIMNDEIFEEGTYIDDYLLSTLIGNAASMDGKRRRLFIKEVTRVEVFFIYQVGKDVSVEVSAKLESIEISKEKKPLKKGSRKRRTR